MLRTILRPSTSTFHNKNPLQLILLNSRRRQPYSVQQQPQPPTNPTVISQYRDRQQAEFRARNRSLLLYAISIGVVTLGLSYAAVPLYRAFCSATGYNGTPSTSSSRDGTGKFAPDRIAQPVGQKTITVRFNADKSDTLDWKFWPCQKSLTVKPGETVLAFYKAKNLSDHDLLGVATYNVTPGQVAPYFAKVECFCFDEQRLLAGEEVDLPIFFFIDKDFVEDPLMKDIDDIVLSYTFFKAKRNSYGFLEPDIPANSPHLSGFGNHPTAAPATPSTHIRPSNPTNNTTSTLTKP
ncbi:Cytochrome c oxidase assembly protein cox11, mitochondrial [Puccinia graminis f. sp. tritici]|uniref:Cytochrome c oxidase assembly protein cox11, mitochondrial n=1 Tax=Puccinia graminis f. sp. tritici TaxID=56615 RepID=A0A5B0RJZ2_PUCGR|nr:Cytochrome c oxidase assembly protein cox11, mitochondrial [Puccinia graminis f. sp. tritici]KAA1125253.1 Cytochrome c oxidase assembly protein cox11, mitochondrial [Puccinia graminis f. sp. tritici]